MKTIFSLFLVASLFTAIESCTKNEMQNVKPVYKTEEVALANESQLSAMTSYSSLSTYFDWHLFRLKILTFTGPAAKELIAQTRLAHIIYVYDSNFTNTVGKPFQSIANAVKSENNEQLVWRVFQLRFSRGVSPRQFYSEEDLLNAVNTSKGNIIITETGTVYQGGLYDIVRAPVDLPSHGFLNADSR